ncbi:helix-turn-helix domain-containing protein [Brevibacillus panacihumi]
MGTSYRHLNRVLKQFGAEGLVERSKGSVLVKNREGLPAWASQNLHE